MFKDSSIDFIYIDGCHTYDAVLQDLKNYYSKIKYGGLVCGHDFSDGWPDVRQAVLDFFKKRPRSVYLDGSWVYKKDVISFKCM